MSEPVTEAGRALLEVVSAHVVPVNPEVLDDALAASIRRVEAEARAPALALLRLLGADRACEPIVPVVGSDEPMCLGHAQRMPSDAARCTVGAAWDALGVEG